MPRLRGLPLAVAALLVSTSCAAADEPPAPATPDASTGALPDGVTLSFLQQRREEGSPAARIRVANAGDETLVVDGVALDWPGYADTAGDYPYSVEPGETWDLPFTLSTPDCDPAVADVAPEASVVVAGERLTGPVDAFGTEFLTRIWRAQCARIRLDEAVAVSYADLDIGHASADGQALHAGLVLTRRAGDDPVRLAANQGSVLFDLTVGRPRLLAAGRDALRLDLDVRPTRCDEHALGQAAQPFFFRYWIAVGEGEPTYVIVEPDETERELLLDFWHLACGDRTEDSVG
jgi:hypothetical protein